MTDRLATREKRLVQVSDWRAEAKLKSELSKSRRGEHKSPWRPNVVAWVSTLALVAAMVVGAFAPLAEASGVVAVVLAVGGVVGIVWSCA